MGKSVSVEMKALGAMIVMQMSFAWMFFLIKATLDSGTKPSVFVAYRQILATLFLTPFAFFFTITSKESSPPLTWRALFNIFMVSSFGLGLSLNLNFVGLSYISATVGTAMGNLIPTMVFIMAVCLRMEKVDISKWHGMSKVIGMIVSLGGAMAFTFYKGTPIFTRPTHHSHSPSPSLSLDHEKTYTEAEWIKGCFLCVAADISYSLWIIMQGRLLKQCPGKLRLLTLQCGFSCIGSIIYGASIERNISSWKIQWDISLLTIVYCATVVTGISYWLQAWVIEKKGPVFTALFGPLALIISAILSAIFLKEILYWGSVLGGVLLSGGLYWYLWGKNREAQIEAQQKMDLSNVETHLMHTIVTSPPSDAQGAKIQSEAQQETERHL